MLNDITGAKEQCKLIPMRVNILGVGVSAINMDQALETVSDWIAERKAEFIICRDAHGLIRCQKDNELRRIHDKAGLVTPDGMPLVWLIRKAGQSHVSRVYGPDLMLALVGKTGYRHFFYGGTPGIPERLATVFRTKYPNVLIAGIYSPPFRSLSNEEDEKVCALIREAQPDIVWVGLGTPKQERWMASHVNRLNGAVLIGVGAAFDFHAGTIKQAPRWLQRSGFEWLFRLIVEPRRLWKRYFTVIPLFMLHALIQATGLKRYPLDDDCVKTPRR
jgi:N-acetylglucosaminyldiphosphoundecaprenol N-acetyl-beta-D-mannosaminyltransferase